MRYLISFCTLLFTTVIFAQESPKDILLKSSKAIGAQRSVQYNATARLKFFDSEDTGSYKGKVYLLRDIKDTFFGAKIWLSRNDTSYKFYDGAKIYEVDGKKKEVTTYDVKNKNESWAMTGNTFYRIVWPYFLEPGKLKEYTDTANTLKRLADTSINGLDCYAISIKFPDEEEMTKHKRWIYIDKKSYMPVFTKRKIMFQGNYQYDEFLIHSYTFNKVAATRFSSKQIPKSYKAAAYERKEIKPLADGTKVPPITGKLYGNMSDKSLNFEGKVTVLDFWYSTCGPCIKAIPEMEKLKEKYAGTDVRVYGINAFDADSASLKRMPKFLEHNPIDYPIILVDKSVPRSYQVEAWPTMYIIDKSGKVAYSTIGYSDKLYSEMSSVIDELLK
ncbi:MAG: TlpA family protein disulfide reductase [Bacteroidetes bacterium]|nr:TlpA family protein disulfide reductase [Bacteroidota bacterium]